MVCFAWLPWACAQSCREHAVLVLESCPWSHHVQHESRHFNRTLWAWAAHPCLASLVCSAVATPPGCWIWWTFSVFVIVVQSLSCVWLFATPWTAACQASLPLTISWSLPKFLSIESVMPSNHVILCHHLLLLLISQFSSDANGNNHLKSPS